MLYTNSAHGRNQIAITEVTAMQRIMMGVLDPAGPSWRVDSSPASRKPGCVPDYNDKTSDLRKQEKERAPSQKLPS